MDLDEDALGTNMPGLPRARGDGPVWRLELDGAERGEAMRFRCAICGAPVAGKVTSPGVMRAVYDTAELESARAGESAAMDEVARLQDKVTTPPAKAGSPRVR